MVCFINCDPPGMAAVLSRMGMQWQAIVSWIPFEYSHMIQSGMLPRIMIERLLDAHSFRQPG